MVNRLIVVSVLCLTAAAGVDAAPNGLVALLTDYGADSLYVGILKGSMLAKAGDIRIETLTNSVPSFDIAAGAFFLLEGCQAWPKGTTFCCVVDPGVGTDRKCIVLETKTGYYFVGPDNGLLYPVAEEHGVATLRECTNKDLWRSGAVSTTFHGRDVFGPVAAALASGTPVTEAGRPIERMVPLEYEPSRIEGGAAAGMVMRSDSYGNLITNIRAEDLANLGITHGDQVAVRIGRAEYTAPFVSTYASVPAGARLVLVQSSGFVECAVNLSSLTDSIREGAHAYVLIKKAPPAP